ncbi:MAG: hypothetical protein QM661_06960 [Solimonas sp.]
MQVLKGPQGTLFGRNTTGGAVLIVPKKPSDEFGGYVEVSGGDYTMQRIQAVLNTPVTDNFKLRFGLDYNKRDGHLRNITGELGNVDYVAGRLSALWNITDSIENYTIFTYADSDNNGSTSKLYQCNPSAINNSFYVFVAVQCQNQLDTQAANHQNGFYDLESTIASPMNRIKELRAINTCAATARATSFSPPIRASTPSIPNTSTATRSAPRRSSAAGPRAASTSPRSTTT